jgi:GMP synthase-like glutamine amidotransferase
MRFLVLQHISCEPPAIYEDVLRERGAEVVRVELDEGETMPDWREFDAIVVMGGPMSANDDKELPWLTDEKRLISEAVRAGIPYWGVCLGCQLLAGSLGARVYRGPRPEVGMLHVGLTPDGESDPIFRQAPREFLTLQWHNDTFEIPAGGVLLASSAVYAAQAFRWGRSAYGLQFHLEISAELAREWGRVPAYANDLSAVLGPNALPELISELERLAPGVNSLGRKLFEAWLASSFHPTQVQASLVVS